MRGASLFESLADADEPERPKHFELGQLYEMGLDFLGIRNGIDRTGTFSIILAVPATLYCYRNVVPTTHEMARSRLFERIIDETLGILLEVPDGEGPDVMPYEGGGARSKL